VESLDILVDGNVSFFHVQLLSSDRFTDAVLAPITECIIVSLDTDYPSSLFDAAWTRFMEASKGIEGLCALSSGWVVEEQKNEKAAGGLAKTFFVLNITTIEVA